MKLKLNRAGEHGLKETDQNVKIRDQIIRHEPDNMTADITRRTWLQPAEWGGAIRATPPHT